jgi:hypothetical protein
MAYYRKNKRRFDPRYFMNERLEELQLSDAEPDLRRPEEDEEDTPEARERAFHPETVRQRLEKAFAAKALEDEEEAVHHVAAAADEQGEIDDRNRKFDAVGSKKELEEGCGDVAPESFFVKSHKLGTTLTAGDPNAAADFVKHLLSLGHTEEDLEMSDEVWAVLGMSPPDAELEES